MRPKSSSSTSPLPASPPSLSSPPPPPPPKLQGASPLHPSNSPPPPRSPSPLPHSTSCAEPATTSSILSRRDHHHHTSKRWSFLTTTCSTSSATTKQHKSMSKATQSSNTASTGLASTATEKQRKRLSLDVFEKTLKIKSGQHVGSGSATGTLSLMARFRKSATLNSRSKSTKCDPRREENQLDEANHRHADRQEAHLGDQVQLKSEGLLGKKKHGPSLKARHRVRDPGQAIQHEASHIESPQKEVGRGCQGADGHVVDETVTRGSEAQVPTPSSSHNRSTATLLNHEAQPASLKGCVEPNSSTQPQVRKPTTAPLAAITKKRFSFIAHKQTDLISTQNGAIKASTPRLPRPATTTAPSSTAARTKQPTPRTRPEAPAAGRRRSSTASSFSSISSGLKCLASRATTNHRHRTSSVGDGDPEGSQKTQKPSSLMATAMALMMGESLSPTDDGEIEETTKDPASKKDKGNSRLVIHPAKPPKAGKNSAIALSSSHGKATGAKSSHALSGALSASLEPTPTSIPKPVTGTARRRVSLASMERSVPSVTKAMAPAVQNAQALERVSAWQPRKATDLGSAQTARVLPASSSTEQGVVNMSATNTTTANTSSTAMKLIPSASLKPKLHPSSVTQADASAPSLDGANLGAPPSTTTKGKDRIFVTPRYELLSELGKGSFGYVWRCYDHTTQKHCAMKIIRNKKRYVRQGEIEVNILKHLNKHDPHDRYHLVRMSNNFYYRKHLCIVFELLSMNLYEFIKLNRFRGFSQSLTRRLTIQMLASLSFLKQQDVVHCDLKPENVLLKHPTKSAIKMIDFGSSCFKDEAVYTYIQSRFYRAPEVILGVPYHQAIDMWSLGCIVAELHTGLPIFPGECEEEQLQCMMEVLGVPPLREPPLNTAKRRDLFFDSHGLPLQITSKKGVTRIPDSKKLVAALRQTEPDDFTDFVARCLVWNPEKRLTPERAREHPFVVGRSVARIRVEQDGLTVGKMAPQFGLWKRGAEGDIHAHADSGATVCKDHLCMQKAWSAVAVNGMQRTCPPQKYVSNPDTASSTPMRKPASVRQVQITKPTVRQSSSLGAAPHSASSVRSPHARGTSSDQLLAGSSVRALVHHSSTTSLASRLPVTATLSSNLNQRHPTSLVSRASRSNSHDLKPKSSVSSLTHLVSLERTRKKSWTNYWWSTGGKSGDPAVAKAANAAAMAAVGHG